MPRPKNDGTSLPAKVRIEESFWQLLMEMPYSHISIKRLASKANVNHKTIYYYYENIDDLAQKVFEENISINFRKTNPLIALLSGYQNELFETQMTKISTERVLLYCKSDSPFLNSIFKEYIRKNWLYSLGRRSDDLTDDENTDLDFIISGMIALLGKDFSKENIIRALRIFDRNLGKAIQSSFMQIKRKS